MGGRRSRPHPDPALGRPGRRRRRQRAGRRADPREDPRRREGSGDGRSVEPARPSVRRQAALPRYQLLRHLQPPQRHAGEPAAGADHGDHGLRHHHRQAQRRCRRDRVRHRLRRHDRRHQGGASDHRPRRQIAVRRLGQRPADLSRPHRRRLPQSVPDHRSRQPVGAVEHGGVDRAACRLGGRSAGGVARGRLHDHGSNRNRAGRLGAAHGRLFDADAASAGQHLVHGRQRSRQGAGRDALYRRRRPLPQHLQRGRRPRHAGLQARRAPTLPSNATMARWFACSRTCGWCWACWRR